MEEHGQAFRDLVLDPLEISRIDAGVADLVQEPIVVEELVRPSSSRQALADLVCAATGRPGVGQVILALDGQPIEVPRGDGSLTSEPLTRSD